MIHLGGIIIEKFDISLSSANNGIKGLVSKKVIAKNVEMNKMYFINPHIMYRGNYTQKYIKTSYSEIDVDLKIKSDKIIDELLSLFPSRIERKIGDLLYNRYKDARLSGRIGYTVYSENYTIGWFTYNKTYGFMFKFKDSFKRLLNKYFGSFMFDAQMLKDMKSKTDFGKTRHDDFLKDLIELKNERINKDIEQELNKWYYEIYKIK